ncbi:MAG: hypothetical protein IJS26_06380 [Alphaproteobacteria bacterium]|nr:hypothetical protein [Alphaproteobacteria bacterium]
MDERQEKIKQERIKQIVQEFALKAANMDIKTNLALTKHQLDLLKKIHVLAVNRALSVPEVSKDPRKISYYANKELKIGVVSLLMTHVLINHLSSAKYTEEFLFENIMVYTEDSFKYIKLENIEEKIFKNAIYDEIVFDFIIYRTPGNRGIKSLSDEKTFSQGLKNFYKGMSPVSEFSRFERKYFEEKQAKKKNSIESAQTAFRNSFVQKVAEAVAKQLLEKQDATEIAKQLFVNKDYQKEIEKIISDMPLFEQIEKIENKTSRELATIDIKQNKNNQEDDLVQIMSQIRAIEQKEK